MARVRKDTALASSSCIDAESLVICIVGLEGSWRGEFLESQLRAQGFEPKIIYGLDYRGVTTKGKDSDFCSLYLGRDVSGPEIGCLRSHLKAYETVRELLDENDWVLIFEDDAILNAEFLEFIRNWKKFIPRTKTPTLLSFYWPYAFVSKFSKFNPIKLVSFSRRKILSEFYECKVAPYSTVAYALNGSAIMNALESPTLETTADWPPWIYQCKQYVSKKIVVDHPPDSSVINRITEVHKTDETELVFFAKIRNACRASLELFRYAANHNIPRKLKICLASARSLLYFSGAGGLLLDSKIVEGRKAFPYQQKPFFHLTVRVLKRLLKFIYWRLLKPLLARALKLPKKITIANNRSLKKSALRLKRYLKRVWKLLHRAYIYLKRFENLEENAVFWTGPDYIRTVRSNFSFLKSLPEARHSENVLDQGKFHNNPQKTISCSCIITTFNQNPELIERALVSAVKQRSAFQQIIIWDGGSTNPQTISFLDKLIAQNIHGIEVKIETTKGIVETRNKAARLALTDFLVFLDPDDWLEDTFVELASKVVSKYPLVEILYPDVNLYSGNKKIDEWHTGPVTLGLLLQANRIPISSVIKREIFEQLHGFSEVFDDLGAEDWELWTRAAAHGVRFARIPNLVFNYSVMLPDSRSSKLESRLEEQKKKIHESVGEIV